MESGSPSHRRSWADGADVEPPSPWAFGAGSPDLPLECLLARGPEDVLSDSEDDLSAADPLPSLPPPGKGKEVAEPSARRQRARRHQKRRGRPEGFMAASRRSHPEAAAIGFSPPRHRSPPAHSARARGPPDAEGYHLVRSRRFGRQHPSPPTFAEAHSAGAPWAVPQLPGRRPHPG